MKTKIAGLAVLVGLLAQPYAFAQENDQPQQEEAGDPAGSDSAAGTGTTTEVGLVAGATLLAVGLVSAANDGDGGGRETAPGGGGGGGGGDGGGTGGTGGTGG